MPMLDSGPCQNWPYICDAFPEEPTVDQQALIDQAVQAATEALWNRTRRMFGLCSVKLRPCAKDCMSGAIWSSWWTSWGASTGWTWPFPALVGGQWINLACGFCGDNCSCTRLAEVQLPYPVAEIEQVMVDGAVLDPSAYRVDDWRKLVRIDGGEWPRCNNLNLADTEVGTWSVTASYGEQVPTLGSLAVGELASQIYLRCTGGKGCTLPAATVQQVTRQGVTKVFFDANTAFKSSKIGLYYPDLFIATYNPKGGRQARVFDIDKPRARNVGSVDGSLP